VEIELSRARRVAFFSKEYHPGEIARQRTSLGSRRCTQSQTRGKYCLILKPIAERGERTESEKAGGLYQTAPNNQKGKGAGDEVFRSPGPAGIGGSRSKERLGKGSAERPGVFYTVNWLDVWAEKQI